MSMELYLVAMLNAEAVHNQKMLEDVDSYMSLELVLVTAVIEDVVDNEKMLEERREDGWSYWSWLDGFGLDCGR